MSSVTAIDFTGGGGGGGSKPSKGWAIGIAIFIGIVFIVLVVIVSLGLTKYKCDWGWAADDDPDCSTPTPSLIPFAPKKWKTMSGTDEATGDVKGDCKDNAVMDPNNDIDTSKAENMPGATKHESNGTVVWYADGCGWCKSPYYFNGQCYTDESGLYNADGLRVRRRVWVDDKTGWQWCNWNGSKWVDSSTTGTKCAAVADPLTPGAFARTRRGRSSARRTTRQSSRTQGTRASNTTPRFASQARTRRSSSSSVKARGRRATSTKAKANRSSKKKKRTVKSTATAKRTRRRT